MKGSYTGIQLDAMREIINIGGGNAATSISQWINKPVTMEVPTIEIYAYDELFNSIMAEDQLVYAVTTQMIGNAGGVFLFTLTAASAELITDMMLPYGIEKTEELMASEIKELVNVLVNSFLNAVGRLLDLNLLSSLPHLIIDMFGAVISSLYMEFDQYDEQIMIIKNEFFYQGNKMEASLYFIPKTGVLNQLFLSLGI